MKSFIAIFVAIAVTHVTMPVCLCAGHSTGAEPSAEVHSCCSSRGRTAPNEGDRDSCPHCNGSFKKVVVESTLSTIPPSVGLDLPAPLPLFELFILPSFTNDCDETAFYTDPSPPSGAVLSSRFSVFLI